MLLVHSGLPAQVDSEVVRYTDLIHTTLYWEVIQGLQTKELSSSLCFRYYATFGIQSFYQGSVGIFRSPHFRSYQPGKRYYCTSVPASGPLECRTPDRMDPCAAPSHGRMARHPKESTLINLTGRQRAEVMLLLPGGLSAYLP